MNFKRIISTYWKFNCSSSSKVKIPSNIFFVFKLVSVTKNIIELKKKFCILKWNFEKGLTLLLTIGDRSVKAVNQPWLTYKSIFWTKKIVADIVKSIVSLIGLPWDVSEEKRCSFDVNVICILDKIFDTFFSICIAIVSEWRNRSFKAGLIYSRRDRLNLLSVISIVIQEKLLILNRWLI